MTLRSMKRRLLALLAADTAGYTLLMESHEEDTHARLSQLRTEVINPCIRSHRGIVKHVGDGFLAQFASHDRCGGLRHINSGQPDPRRKRL